MTIFAFLRLLQSALISGLFRRAHGFGKVRYEFATPACARALGMEHDYGVTFCPITLVCMFLGHGYVDTGDYGTASGRLGLDHVLAGRIVDIADTESRETDPDTNQPLYASNDQAPRETFDHLTDPPVPAGWSCV